jgi:hypothetical protein
MTNLTDEDIRWIACNEWARWMEAYGSGRSSSLNNERQIQTEQGEYSIVSRHLRATQSIHNRRQKSTKAA